MAQTNSAAETAFFSWLRSSGASIAESVGLASFDAEGMGRGAVALQDIPVSSIDHYSHPRLLTASSAQADTLLFSLPRSILLNISNSALPSLLPDGEFASLVSDAGGWTPLILCMMYESLRPAGTSPWSTYFDLLPPPGAFDSLMFWSDDELNELKGSLVLSKIGRDEAEEEYRDKLLPFVEKHESVLGSKDGYTLERFHWCGSLILSRSFHVDVKDNGEEAEGEESEDEEEDEERENVEDVAMVPLADLLNAKSGCDNVSGRQDPRVFVANPRSFALMHAGPTVLRAHYAQYDVHKVHPTRGTDLQHVRRPAEFRSPSTVWPRRRRQWR